MQIVALSDLHYHPETKDRVATCAERVNACDAEVLVIAGDFSSISKKLIDECIALFQPFPGKKIAVAGNHDLWVVEGQSSVEKYSWLADIFRVHGFHFLDEKPVVINDIGFVGNVGWYDYSFRRPDAPEPGVQVITAGGVKKWEDLTEEDYSRKILDYAIVADKDLPFMSPEALRKSARRTGWNDYRYIRWDYTDLEFTDICVQKLRSDIEQIEPQVEKIVAVTHHLPFENMAIRKGRAGWDFNNAFVGSKKMGEVLLSCEKVSVSICGHTHVSGTFVNGHIKCYNVSSSREHDSLLIEV